MLAITSGGDFVSLKGVIEAIVARLNRHAVLSIVPGPPNELLDEAHSGELLVDGERLGFLGEVSSDGLRRFDFAADQRLPELKLAVLDKLANLVPQYERLPPSRPSNAT